MSVLLSSLKGTLAARKTSRILGCTRFSHCRPTPPHLWPTSVQTGRCLLSTTSKHACLCVSSADPYCKERECVPECTVTLISRGICHLSDVTGAEARCPQRKEMRSLISTPRQPPSHYPAGTAVCSSCSSYFSACTRATAFEQVPTITQHSLHSRCLCLLHSYAHPKHPLLKIKGLPNSTLFPICWPVAHQSSCYSLPLASC